MKIISNGYRKVFLIITTAFVIGGFFIAGIANAAISTITVTSPNGSEIWSGTQSITWTSTNDGVGDNFKIYYSTDNFTSQSAIVGASNVSGSSFSWNTSSLPDGTNYKIRIYAFSDNLVFDTSNAVFTLDNTPPTVGIVVTDTALKAGETSLVTFTFSEAPIEFTATDVTVANGSIGAVSATVDPLIFTATLTPATIDDVTNIMTVGTDWTDVALNAPIGSTNSNNYTIDTVVPTVVLASVTANPTNSLIAITAEFSETVTGFIDTDITVSGGTVENFAVVDGNSYTFNVDPTDGAIQAVTIQVGATTVVDAAGNANTVSNQLAYTSDTVAPDVTSIILADTDLKAGETSLVTFTFSEAVTGFDNTDITTIDNGTLTAVSSADSGVTWTATFTPTASFEDTSNLITVTKTGVADAAGNAGVGATSSANYTIDTLRPTVVVTMSSATLKVGDTTTVTFTFSEAPTNFTTADVTAANGAIGAIDTTNPLVQTAIFTPTNDIENAINIITVGTAWTDPAGNAPLAGDDSPNYTIDTKVPTATVVVADTALKAGETSLVTFTFSEIVIGFTNADLTIINNGALTTVSSADSGITWTATFTPTADVTDTSNVITIDKTGVLDVAGNAGVGTTNSNNYAIDTAIPTITSITSNATGAGVLKIGDTILFTLTPGSTEAGAIVSGSYNGVTLSWSTGDSGVTYTATYTVVSGNTDQTSALQISGVTITDVAGNTSSTATGTDVVKTIDANVPSAPSIPDMTAETDSNITTDNITNVTTPIFTGTAESGSMVSIYDTDGTTVIGTGTATGGNYSITVSALSVGVHSITAKTADVAGNTSSASSALSVTIDTSTPSAPTTPDLTASTDSNINTDNITNDTTPDFTTTAEVGSTIVVYDGVTGVGSMTATGSADTITVSALSVGVHSITVKTTDIAGNESLASSALSVTVDTLATITSITSNATGSGTLKIGDTILFTLTPGTTEAGATVSGSYNGVVLSWSTVNSGVTYTATYTVASGNTDRTSALQISGVTITDIAGNTSSATAGTDVVKKIDANVPTLVSARTNSITTIDLTFSEDLLGTSVTNSDFSVSGNTLTTPDAFEVTPGVVRLTVSTQFGTGVTPAVSYTGMVEDLAGNVAPTAGPITPTDSVAPTLSPVTIASNNTTTSLAKSGDVVTLTFTSSESVSTPIATINGQSATVAGGPTAWTATRTMTSTDTEGTIPFSIAFEDISPATNDGVTVTATTNASTVLYDRTNPSVNAGTDKEVNATASQDATTSDGGSGLASYAWTKISGLGTITFGSASAVDTTISANTDGTYVLRLTVLDAAGNSAFDEITFIWDTTLPEPLTSSPSDGATGVAITAGTATVTYDEDIVLLDSSRVLFVNDSTGTSYKGTVAVSGGNGNSVILNIPYSGLDYGTKYRINVKPSALEDVAGNNVVTNFISYFTTEIDATSPVINSLSAGSITTTGATLSVTTNESATCKFASTDSSYASMTAMSSTGGTSHSQAITGLTAGTGSTYFVRCQDTLGNAMTTSGVASFTTAAPVADTTAPAVPVLTTAVATTDADTYTVAGTDANDGGTRTISVYNGATLAGTVSIPTGQTSWSLLVSLTQVSANVLTATASDELGNTSAVSTSVTITEATATGDTTAPPTPVITTSTTTVDAGDYTISGTADADTPTDGTRVITIFRGSTVVGSLSLPVGTTAWSFLAPLSQSTTNSFTAKSTDESGNVSSASSAVVITESTVADATGPVVSSIQSTSITTTGVTITWTTNENATSRVEYGTTSSYGTFTATDSSADNTSHSVSITELTSGTEYHFRVISADGIPNSSTSDDNTFTTVMDDTASLAVTGIDTVRSFATADNTFDNGWKWTFHVTVPTNETTFRMKFNDLVSGSNSVLAGTNIRIYSAQSSNAFTAGSALTISAADTYSTDMTLNSDIASDTAGRQIDVTVEVRVPTTTAGGSYSTSYGVQSL